ncbi:sigma-70 family RNA polymerase sigma factor [Nocardioides sp.]|uniref:sigma-70 family RNA polymerase sigma factor n=1 Tax=Nocardioides sp. TaxID=35761 RepID=UPI00352745A0
MKPQSDQLLRELHAEHADALWRFCLKLTAYDRSRAEDLVQETMLRAVRHVEALEGGPGAVRAWLFTVARNLTIDEWRSRRHHRETPTAEVPEQGEPDRTDQLLTSWLVADALTQLSAEHQAVLRECHLRGRSVAEAARQLGIPEGTVKSRTHYAMRALRLALEERGVTA